MTFRPFSRTPRIPGGFTLVELMITVALISILTALGAPSLTQLGQRGVLRADAEAVAAAVAGARQFAVGYGRCTLVGVSSDEPERLQVESVDGLDCEGVADMVSEDVDMTSVSETDIVPLDTRLAKADGITMTLTTPTTGKPVLVWRPNGHMRGTSSQYGSGAYTFDATVNNAIITLTSARLPEGTNKMLVVVLENGLICVNDNGACP